MAKKKPVVKPNQLMPMEPTEAYPFLRLPHEPPQAYARFVLYRELPSHARSLDLLGERLGITKQALSPLCSEYNWRERAKAYDAFFRTAQARKNPELVVEAMLADHAELLFKLRQKVATAIENLDPQWIGPKELPSLLRLVLQEERLAASLTSDPALLAKLAEKQQSAQQTTVNVNQGPIIVMPDNGRGDSNLQYMKVETVDSPEVLQLGQGEEE